MKRTITNLMAVLFTAFMANGQVTVSDNITENTTWSSDNVYLLDGGIFVEEGAKLTIEAGTVIKGKPGTGSSASYLCVSRGAQIEAIGTKDKPIIFTSEDDDLEGSVLLQENGKWGGLIILGKGTHNNDDNNNEIEGVVPDGENGLYGGDVEDDNSGQLKYVSIRHAGIELAPDEEINGLSMGAVGAGTTIDYIEVLSNKDDGIEFWGGAPQVKHALVAYCGDDSYDFDEGYHGYGQYWFAIQADQAGGECGEHDGGPSDNRYGKPYAHPIISNATYIGRGSSKSILKMREFFGGEYHNSVFANQEKGIRFDYVEGAGSVYSRLIDSGDVVIKNNVFGDNIGDGTEAGMFEVYINDDEANYSIPGDAESKADAKFSEMNNSVESFSIDMAQVVPSVDVSGADFNGLPEWFDQVSYKGAFDPDVSSHWGQGWSKTFESLETSIVKNETVSVDVSIYPNPVVDNATVNFNNPNNDAYTFALYSLTGQQVKSRTVEGSQFSFDKGSLKSGIYIYVLTNGQVKESGKIRIK